MNFFLIERLIESQIDREPPPPFFFNKYHRNLQINLLLVINKT